jgi:hypothetical protein
MHRGLALPRRTECLYQSVSVESLGEAAIELAIQRTKKSGPKRRATFSVQREVRVLHGCAVCRVKELPGTTMKPNLLHLCSFVSYVFRTADG